MKERISGRKEKEEYEEPALGCSVYRSKVKYGKGNKRKTKAAETGSDAITEKATTKDKPKKKRVSFG